MKTDPEKTKRAGGDDARTMANLTPPQTEKPVGADSLTASQLPFTEHTEVNDPEKATDPFKLSEQGKATEQEKSELDTLRQKPFMLTEQNPTGAPAVVEPAEANPIGAESRSIPKGRLISGSVGIGGENHPEDVKAIGSKLSALGIITPEEAATLQADPSGIGAFVQRYQQKVFNTVNDGLISAGGATEDRLISGITSKATQGKKTAQSPAKPAAKHNQPPKADFGAAAQAIISKGFPASTMGQVLALGNADPQLIAALFPLIAENSQDNFAAAYCQALSDVQLTALPLPLKLAFYNSMKSGFVAPDEVYQMIRLGNSLSMPKEAKEQAVKEKQEGPAEKEAETPKMAEGEFIIGPVLSQKQYLTQAPPNEASHNQTITKDQLFKHSLAKYGPGAAFDISSEEKRTKKGGVVDVYNVKNTYEAALSKIYWLGCYNTSELMVKNGGGVPDFNKAVTTLLQDSNAKVTASNDFSKGLSLLDEELLRGMPVMAGVDKGTITRNSDASDHFIVIVGKVRQGNKIGYCYFDPGTGQPKGWDLKKNILWLNGEIISNEKATVNKKGNVPYHLSRVIPNKH